MNSEPDPGTVGQTNMLPRPARFGQPLCDALPVCARFHDKRILSRLQKSGIAFFENHFVPA